MPARGATGTIRDVAHIVVLMQENRAFDHYFGTMDGVRGFGDRFPVPAPPIPGAPRRTVFVQPNAQPGPGPVAIAPFRLDTELDPSLLRPDGAPHAWADAQAAWNHGRLDAWTSAKLNHSLGHFAQADLPFQWALANAFTLCDAYHCSAQTGTTTNRLFHWTGTNDPLARGHGPATYNGYEDPAADPGRHGGYTWTTYPERLEAAGIGWQVYQDMADNFHDNPLACFRSFRDAWFERPGHSAALRRRGMSTRDLAALRDDVLADRLPPVSWIVAPAADSEHPGPSSPAQGAAYTARVLDALTANPDVWARTALFVNYDENDGYFDHVPPPAPPSYERWHADASQARLAGASTVDTRGEYHEVIVPEHDRPAERALLHRPYGLGPRVPMIVVSPWSRGGWVCSQVFDHTSVLRFIERRFGVAEPNISAWRRAVCGDLTSAFDFSGGNGSAFTAALPATAARAAQAARLRDLARPPTPAALALPVQRTGVRRSRPLPYALEVTARLEGAAVLLQMANTGAQGAVFHVYDRRHLHALPRRCTVGAGQWLEQRWEVDGGYDLWVLGPNGFHRHATGAGGAQEPIVALQADAAAGVLRLRIGNPGDGALRVAVTPNAYTRRTPAPVALAGGGETALALPLEDGHRWYDWTVAVPGTAFVRRFAGRVENGAPDISDPAMGGLARGEF